MLCSAHQELPTLAMLGTIKTTPSYKSEAPFADLSQATILG